MNDHRITRVEYAPHEVPYRVDDLGLSVDSAGVELLDATWLDDENEFECSCGREFETEEKALAHLVMVARGDIVEYTPLERFAAEISGKLSLDASAVPELGAAEIYASEAALHHNCERLQEKGFRAKVDEDHEPARLLVYPEEGS